MSDIPPSPQPEGSVPPPGQGVPNPPVAGVVLSVGDIAVTPTEVVLPGGARHPLKGATWIVSNNTTTTTGISTLGIILCVVFIWVCLLGLLFLLMKETKTSGYVQVSVQGPDYFYATQIPVSKPDQVMGIEQQVNQIRGLVAQLG